MFNQKIAARADIGRILRLSCELDPRHCESSRRLARYLFTTDALEELVQDMAPTLHYASADPECLHFVGLAALKLGDYSLAEAHLSRAIACGHDESLGPFAKALLAMDRTAEAFSVAMRALDTVPCDDAACQVIFSHLLAEHRFAELWALCLRLRAAGGWTARMVSAMALAAQTADQIALVRRIVDSDAWLEHTKLKLSRWQIGELGETLKNSGCWTALPRTKATVGSGRRIEKLHRVSDGHVLDTLFEQIQAAIADYVAKRADLLGPSAEDQPMVAMRPESLTLASWAVAVNMDGHEGWHIHPDGWLSGVYYVEIPDLSASDAPNSGRLEFGPYPLGPAATDSVWHGWTIQPRVGDLLLFPSYLGHRTWPTHVKGDRICIAFDVLRRGVDLPIAPFEAPRAKSGFGLDDRLTRHARAIGTTDEVGVTLVMNVDSGLYVALDEAGALVWNLLMTPHTARELTHAFLRQFDATETEIARDLIDLLSVMISCDFVEKL